ncbi:MAG: sel1 repeat family protein, partial [Chlamydiia bacterium]|nr:sel1 repeat family protein [Chlamydiia bacterium]
MMDFKVGAALIALMGVIGGELSAAEVSGKIQSVGANKEIEIRIDDPRIKRGDQLVIGFEIQGEGFIPLEGVWKVNEISSGVVKALPENAENTSTPIVGYTARITLSADQSNSEVTSPSQVQPQGQQIPQSQIDGVGVDEADRHFAAGRYAEALKGYQSAAEQGNSWAQFRLGYLYEKGLGTPAKLAEAAHFYKLAAEAGDANAMNNLGWFYKQGDGVQQDLSRAVELFRRSAELGNSYGQTNLGYMYENGLGVSRDPKMAFYWYKKAAEQGFSNAQANLGILYQKGVGTE